MLCTFIQAKTYLSNLSQRAPENSCVLYRRKIWRELNDGQWLVLRCLSGCTKAAVKLPPTEQQELIAEECLWHSHHTWSLLSPHFTGLHPQQGGLGIRHELFYPPIIRAASPGSAPCPTGLPAATHNN